MAKARMDYTMMDWKTIPWGQLERNVFKLQTRIFKASQHQDSFGSKGAVRQGIVDNYHFIEEPCEVKVCAMSRT